MAVNFLLVAIFVAVSQVCSVHGESLAAAAMTTVLARPLGGYGLTPLVFEPAHGSFQVGLQGSSSNSVPTKVRKSPVYELIYPEEEQLASIPTTVSSYVSGTKSTAKKVDYESLVATPAKTLKMLQGNKAAIASAAPASSQDYFANVIDLLKIKDSSASSSYNAPMMTIPNYGASGAISGGGRVAPLSYGGGNGGGAAFFGGGQQQLSTGGFGGGSGLSQGPLTAAIQSIRSVEVQDIQDSFENNEPQVIDIPPSAMPIVINFRTSSSALQIHQTHEPTEQQQVQETQSEDEPHFLKHQVTKPVIQEVHEIIMPYRRIVQEIRPVEEEIKTIVARGQKGTGGAAIAGNGAIVAGGGGAIITGGSGTGGGGYLTAGNGGHQNHDQQLAYALSKLTSSSSSSSSTGSAGTKTYKSKK